MSTRAFIGLMLQDGTIQAVYNHGDGYVEHLGKILKEGFNNTEDIEKLINNGGISFIDTEEVIKEYADRYGKDYLDSFTNIKEGYMARLYNDNILYKFTNEKQYKEYFCDTDSWIQYVYLFKDEKWIAYKVGTSQKTNQKCIRKVRNF